MKHIRPLFLTFFLLSASAFALAPGLVIDVEKGPNPWTSLDIRGTGPEVRFVVTADRNGGNRAGIFPRAVEKINLLAPQFVICVGDHITGYMEDRRQLNRDWDEVLAEMRRLKAPFFLVPGNHDLTNQVEAAVWKERLGRAYYHFRWRDALFLIINSEDGGYSKISDAQVAYFKGVLDANRDARWTFAFLHKPFWHSDSDSPDSKCPNFNLIEAALHGRKYTMFAGHEHEYTRFNRKGMKYIQMATTGGGSKLRGPAFGEFDHFAMVTLEPEGPMVANLLLDGVEDENVTTPEALGVARKSESAVPRQAVAQITAAASVDSMRTRFTTRNESAVPVRVSVALDRTGPFSVVTAPGEIVVKPGKSAELTLALKASGPVAVAGLEPFPYRWRVSAVAPGGREFAQEGTGQIMVENPLPVSRAPRPVKVDGVLDEWGDLPVSCEKPWTPPDRPGLWKGPADASFRFAVAYDDEFIYMAARVRDDSVVAVPGVDPWDQDGIGFEVEARPEQDWNPGKEGKYQYCFLSPGPTAEKTIVWGLQWMPKGMKAACVKSRGGWIAEYAVPLQELQDAGKPWQALRVNVKVYDFDRDTGSSGTYLSWRPDWKAPESWPGSGAFARR